MQNTETRARSFMDLFYLGGLEQITTINNEIE